MSHLENGVVRHARRASRKPATEVRRGAAGRACPAIGIWRRVPPLVNFAVEEMICSVNLLRACIPASNGNYNAIHAHGSPGAERRSIPQTGRWHLVWYHVFDRALAMARIWPHRKTRADYRYRRS